MELIVLNVVLVNELACGPRVYKGQDRFHFCSISGFDFDFKLERCWVVFSGSNDEFRG